MNSNAAEAPTLKTKTARTLKWNTIDRLSTQVVYAIVGVVLANILSKEDFGLVGALLVFQAFAILFVDSGFGAALLQKKEATQDDYSTVFWFNTIVAIVVYTILWVCARPISDIFQHDARLIPMSRVMFLTFVLNGLGIVQTNRLMKKMEVKQLAISNLTALVASGLLAIWLALRGYGAWALVWQYITLAAVKTGWLWVVCHWWPTPIFSMKSMKKIWRVGLGVFSSSMLNTIFLNVYSFIIGACYNLASLGVYTQADKWSKMGSASLSQIFTASFVPLLAKVQDKADDFHRYMGKINRFAAFLVFPSLLGLALIAEPLFHTLFSSKWDDAIPLFQLLCVRGIAVVMVSLCNNFMLSLGYARSIVVIEIVKDVLTIAAILVTVFTKSLLWLVVGQTAASFVAFAYILFMTSRNTGYPLKAFAKDNAPYLLLTIAMLPIAGWVGGLFTSPLLVMLAEIATAVVIYVGVLKIFRATTLTDAINFIRKKN